MKSSHTYSISLLLTIVTALLLSSCNDDTDNGTISNPSSRFKWGETKANVMRGLTDYDVETSNNSIYARRLYDDIHTAYQFVNDSLCAIVMLASENQITDREINHYTNGYDFIGSLSEEKNVYMNINQNRILQIQTFKFNETQYFSIGWAPIQ